MRLAFFSIIVACASLRGCSLLPAQNLPQEGLSTIRIGRTLVRVWEDVSYVAGNDAASGSRHRMDLYVPEGAGPFPIIIWVHGGAWAVGDKEACPPASFAPAGFAAASINYRLTDMAPFPAQINDVRAAIGFLRANAARFNIDPNRIGIWGVSAGGHLAALAGTAWDEKSFQGPADGCRVQAVCDWAGPSDLVSAQAQAGPGFKLSFDGRSSPVWRLLDGDMTAARKAAASPVTYVSSDDPPFLVMHGDADDVVPLAQSQEFYDRLKKAGVDVSLVVLKGAGHSFGGKKDLRRVLEFFQRTLKKDVL